MLFVTRAGVKAGTELEFESSESELNPLELNLELKNLELEFIETSGTEKVS